MSNRPVGDVMLADEAPAPVRRPRDLLRTVGGALTLTLVLVLGAVATDTMSGAQSDLTRAGQHLPALLRQGLYAVTSLLLLAVPVALLVRQALWRRWRQIGEAFAASLLALGASFVLAAWIVHGAPESLQRALTSTVNGPPAPTASYLAAFVAFVAVTDVSGRPGWASLAWGSVALSAVAAILAGASTPLHAAVMYVLGQTIAAAVTYAAGSANVRPPAREVVRALRSLRLDVASCLPGAAAGDGRVYEVVLRSGDQLRVVVLDRDQQGYGLVYRTYRWLRLQGPAARRSIVTLRRATDHQALLAYAARAAGARTPELIGVCPVGPDATLLAFTDRPVETFDALGDDVTAEQLRGAWEQVRLLHDAFVAHRALTLGRFGTDADGNVWLLDVRTGDIAASDFLLRLDVAQFLVESALAVGPERALRAAFDTLGGPRVARSQPFLQPVALTLSTRTALRHHRGLLDALRAGLAPALSSEAPVRLERVRPRTLVTVAAATLAVYILLGQLASVDLVGVVAAADWRWLLTATALSALTYVAAALSLSGWVVEGLRFGRTLLVQVAASFVTLIAPATVGGVALNARYLQRAGIPPALAVASVGVSQAVGLVVHVVLLALFVFLTGTSTHPAFSVPGWAYVIAGVVAALVATVVVLPRGRAWLRDRVRPLITETLPRLLEVLQRPRKLAAGLGGTVLLSAAYVLCLWAAVHAFGGDLHIATVAVVYLAGSAIGSAAPTPGGLGAIEAALAAGLTAAGLPSVTAVSAVLLFRLVTFWLPVLPGWLAFGALQRRHAI
ncbi:MAG: integral rane protein-like protein [Mycobacterium sp.]|nr:integral rane protein-like protein [Mycobacterium sp.]